MIDRRSLLAAGAAAAGALALPAARAQAYPDRAIKVVVPWPAGGNADVTIRPVLDRMAQILGQPIVAENRAGATGNVGSAQAARATPDGYSLLQLSSSTILNSALSPDKTYDLQRDFEPIGLVASTPMVLEVHPSVPARTLAEFVQLARSQPGQLSYGTAGSSIHLAVEQFSSAAGVKMNHVPYKGSAPAITDLVGGQIQLLFDPFSSLYPQVSGGKVRALAITTEKRSAVAPGIPTVAEQGYPGFDVSSWQGIVVPAGTPRPIVQRLHRSLARVLDSAEIREKFAQYSAVPGSGSPEQFGQFIRQEIARWQAVAKAAGVKPE
jgi:hypothetical protein